MFDGQIKFKKKIVVDGDKKKIFINGRWLDINKVTIGVLDDMENRIDSRDFDRLYVGP